MSKHSSWKSKLLSSSVPLEYEVARTLVQRGFAVDSDYAYCRDDAGTAKDFSIDLKATRYLDGEEGDIAGQLDLLVECKQRHDQVTWLFFQDPNTPDFSPFTRGHTLRGVDSFSDRVVLHSDCTIRIDEYVLPCFKGVEIDLSAGHVHDAEIRHGLAQLQYSLPRYMVDGIRLFDTPFFFCPILITTAPILVARPDTTIETVRSAEELQDFSEQVPSVVLHIDPSPGFDRHRVDICSPLLKGETVADMRQLEQDRKALGARAYRSPLRICKRLARPGQPLHEYFSQFVVCSYDGLPELLTRLVNVTEEATKAAMTSPPASA